MTNPLEARTEELVAIGAALAANCEPCLRYHVRRGAEAGCTQDEMRRALIEQARRYPGHEKSVYEYFEKTPGALAELRAPIFEDKVVDFVIDKAKPAEKKVSKDELFQKVETATTA